MNAKVARFCSVQTYQNGKNTYTKLPQTIKTAVKFTKKLPTFSIPRPSKINPNWDFGFENKPSGNPDERSLLPSYLCTA
jgi:hypothetical protein